MDSRIETIVAGHHLAHDANFRQWVAAGLLSLGRNADRDRVIAFAEAGWQATQSQADEDRERAKPFIVTERARIRAIIWSEAGKANPPMADFLAFQTDTDAATAIRALEALAASGADGRLS